MANKDISESIEGTLHPLLERNRSNVHSELTFTDKMPGSKECAGKKLRQWN